MSVNPSNLRVGNWIHRKGSAAYGIVNGKLLALLEEDEKERERFEYIKPTPELLEAAGFEMLQENHLRPVCEIWNLSINVKGHNNYLIFYTDRMDEPEKSCGSYTVNDHWAANNFQYLHELQNLIFALTQTELPLPESAKIIPQAVPK